MARLYESVLSAESYSVRCRTGIFYGQHRCLIGDTKRRTPSLCQMRFAVPLHLWCAGEQTISPADYLIPGHLIPDLRYDHAPRRSIAARHPNYLVRRSILRPKHVLDVQILSPPLALPDRSVRR